MTYETELIELAYKNITRDEYPENIPLVSTDTITAELLDLKNGIGRGTDKVKYLIHKATLENQLETIKAQNVQIQLDNAATRQAVKDKFVSDIESWKTLNTSKMLAIRKKRDAELRETDWTQVNDSPLKDNAEILAYRKALRDVTEVAKDEIKPTDKTKEGPTKIIWPVKPGV